MRKICLVLTMLVSASFLLASCDSGGGNTNAPKNTAANNTNSNTTTSSANTETDVKKLIGDLSDALSKNDAAALDKIYADDYTLVTQTGEIATKAQRIEAIKSGEIKFENVVFSDIKVRGYGDTAVAIAGSKGKSTNKGKTSETSFRITFVAHKTKDGWRLVSAHLAPMPEETKTDDSTKKETSNTATSNSAAPEKK